MQTEAAPREPFTIGLLFRYKFTIFVVAVFVILAGYVRIITQPRLYMATARLAVRFTSEAVALAGVSRDNFFRLPLLEEEVKSYQSQLTDNDFLGKVIEALPVPETLPPDPMLTEVETPAQKFRSAFLSAYYNIRKTFFAATDAILLNSDHFVTEKEQRVLQILSRLEVSAGTEASHIITVSYQNPDNRLAADLVNTIARKFIERQKLRVKQKDETVAQTAVDEQVTRLYENRKRVFDIANELGHPTLDKAIEERYTKLERLTDLKKRFEVARGLLAKGIIPFDRELPLEANIITGELEREFFNQAMAYKRLESEQTENTTFYRKLLEQAHSFIDERRKVAIGRDKEVVEAQVNAISTQIQDLLKDDKLVELSSEYTKLTLEETLIRTKLTQAEADLTAVKAFNKELLDENISENITMWAPAEPQPFPLPQHREVKLLVVMALGVFAGCAAALVRHYIRPKLVRRVLPRDEEEEDVPVVILPDDGRGGLEKDLELDISFPSDDAAESARGKGTRR